MVELSICDVFNMPIAILVNSLFVFSFFFLPLFFLFFLLLTVELFLCRVTFFLFFLIIK